MTKLTDTQISVLSKAAARADCAAVLPAKLTRSAAAKVSANLVSRKLMREVRAKGDMPVWREENGRKVALVILKAGRIAVSGEVATTPPSTPLQSALKPASPDTADAPRQGTKQALVIEMLAAGEGATIQALADATGWLAHTTRAALTVLRKRGYGVERARGVDGMTRYSLRVAATDVQA